MSSPDPVRIERWNPDSPTVNDDVQMLGDVLHDSVHAGASVSFVLPFAREEAVAFWRDQVLPVVRDGSRRVLVARIGERIVGTVQLDLATPPNQPHRAEVRKLLVHPEARRRGIARSLMAAVEELAHEERRTLLTLDTVTDSSADPLYRSLGYVAIGAIPGYALNSGGDVWESATFFYKELSADSVL